MYNTKFIHVPFSIVVHIYKIETILVLDTVDVRNQKNKGNLLIVEHVKLYCTSKIQFTVGSIICIGVHIEGFFICPRYQSTPSLPKTLPAQFYIVSTQRNTSLPSSHRQKVTLYISLSSFNKYLNIQKVGHALRMGKQYMEESKLKRDKPVGNWPSLH